MMKEKIYSIILLWSISARANEPELPMCPANIQYFPQNLPMHCRMPNKTEFKNFPYPLPPGMSGLPGLSSLPGGPSPMLPQPQPMPPGIPQPMLPGGPQPILPGGPQPMMSMGMPGLQGPPPGFPGPLPGLPGGMPMPQKLPVVVMPFYSQDRTAKHLKKHKLLKANNHIRRPHYYSEESSNLDESKSSEKDSWWRSPKQTRRHHHEKRRKHKQRKPMLTPLLQYVTKDGYVIYEKTLSNGEAKTWLGNNNENKSENNEKHNNERESAEMPLTSKYKTEKQKKPLEKPGQRKTPNKIVQKH